jgi:hypothetical protein
VIKREVSMAVVNLAMVESCSRVWKLLSIWSMCKGCMKGIEAEDSNTRCEGMI